MCNSISYCDWKEGAVIKDHLAMCKYSMRSSSCEKHLVTPFWRLLTNVVVGENAAEMSKQAGCDVKLAALALSVFTSCLLVISLQSSDLRQSVSIWAIGREMSERRCEWQVNLDRAVEMWEGSGGGWRVVMGDGGILRLKLDQRSQWEPGKDVGCRPHLIRTMEPNCNMCSRSSGENTEHDKLQASKIIIKRILYVSQDWSGHLWGLYGCWVEHCITFNGKVCNS